LLRDGMTVVLAGAPNAGKSSLLNRLAGYDAAIVTAVPGTTRDVLRERIHVDGMPLHVLDTAGLRVAQDSVEEEGIRRAQLEMARADRVLFVIDGAHDPCAHAYRDLAITLPVQVPVTLIYNKADITDANAVSAPPGVPRIDVSALTGQGLDDLRAHLKSCMGYHTLDGSSVSARQRHIEALARAHAAVEEAARVLQHSRAGDLVAQELRVAQRALDEISGEGSSPAFASGNDFRCRSQRSQSLADRAHTRHTAARASIDDGDADPGRCHQVAADAAALLHPRGGHRSPVWADRVRGA
jgi:tRNA modification GTPase